MDILKVVVSIIFCILFFAVLAFAADVTDGALSILPVGELIDQTNKTVEDSNSDITILPIEELPVEEAVNENTETSESTIGILPVEEPVSETNEEVIEEPAEANPSDSLTAGTAAEVPAQQESLLKSVLDLILNKAAVVIGELVKVKAYLLSDDKTPLANQEIKFYANGQEIGTDITNEQGLAKMVWDTSPFTPGVYIVKAAFAGDNVAEGSSGQAEITLNEKKAGQVNEGVVNEAVAEVTVNKETAANEPIITTAAVTQAVVSGIEEIQDCQTVSWKEEKSIYGTCSTEKPINVCSDSPINKSCHADIRVETYPCVTGTQIVQKSQQHCELLGYTINNGVKLVKLNTQDYACTPGEVSGAIIVTCDSKRDGNGNGICTSGESCMRFVVDGSSVKTYEKNSRDDFVIADDTFFLSKASMEVLQ